MHYNYIMKNTNIKNSPRKTNTNDKRYQRNENSIRRVITKAIANRKINLRTIDVCHDANISSPTFYLHCQDSNVALTNYEQEICAEFNSLVPSEHTHHEITFTILLNFIRHHQRYFSAAIHSHNAWLLCQLLDILRPNLVDNHITDRSYTVYAGSLSAIITCWGRHEGFASNKIPFYTRKMTQTRIVKI